jgi:hypothetical protein
MGHLLTVVAFCFLATPVMSMSMDITTCGQYVPGGTTGVLQADLDCPTDSGLAAVLMGGGAKLLLNGHTITGGTGGTVGVGRYAVLGPGEIVGSANSCGISTSTYSGPGGATHYGPGTLRVRDVIVRDGACGIAGAAGMLDNVTVTGHTFFGIYLGRLRAKNVTVANNGGEGFSGVSIRLNEVTAHNNLYGIFASSAQYFRRVLVSARNSTITGNTTSDIYSETLPRLVYTTCGTSDGPVGSWGVCAGD